LATAGLSIYDSPAFNAHTNPRHLMSLVNQLNYDSIQLPHPACHQPVNFMFLIVLNLLIPFIHPLYTQYLFHLMLAMQKKPQPTKLTFVGLIKINNIVCLKLAHVEPAK